MERVRLSDPTAQRDRERKHRRRHRLVRALIAEAEASRSITNLYSRLLAEALLDADKALAKEFGEWVNDLSPGDVLREARAGTS
jgi:hypothetical protein